MDLLRKQRIDSITSLIQDVFTDPQKKLELLKMFAKCIHTISDEEITKLRNELRGIKIAGRSKTSDRKIEDAYNYTYDILRVAIVHANNYRTGREELIAQHLRDLKSLNFELNGLGKRRRFLLQKVSELDIKMDEIKAGLKTLQAELAKLNESISKGMNKERDSIYKKFQTATTLEEKTRIKQELVDINAKIHVAVDRLMKLRGSISGLIRKREENDSEKDRRQLYLVEKEIGNLEYEKEQHALAIQKLREEIGGR